MIAKSLKGKSTVEIQLALEEAISDGFKPTLAIVFISIKQDWKAIAALLDKHNIAVFGVTSNGEFIDEDIATGTIAILLLDIKNEDCYTCFAELNGDDDEKVTEQIAIESLKKYRQPAFLIASSNMQTNAEDLIQGIVNTLGSSVNIFGAMAGDDLTLTEQFVFSNKWGSNRGIVVVVFSEEKILIKGKATSGWKAMGTEKTVTKSEGVRIYTIDNVPALDVCLKYSGLTEETPNLVLEMMTNFPLQMQREKGSPILRPGYLINWEDHSLTCSAKVPQGSKVRFSLPPDFDVIEKVISECQQLKDTEMPEADALIIFNCAGRLISLGPLINAEIEGLKGVWSVAMAGMFSNAELGRATNGNVEMHNLTTCCVALKEK